MSTPNPVAGALGQAPPPRTVLAATVEMHHPDLLKCAIWHAHGDTQLGADVLQQVYENVLKRIAKDEAIPDDPQALNRYMRRAISNGAKDYFKTYGQKVYPQGLDIPQPREESDEGNPEDVILAAAYREIAARVNGLLAKLPERQREVVNLMFWKQMTKEQVADQLGITEQTVARYLRLAKRNLKAEAQNILKEVVA
ncbi:RNA polymerase sigma factor [Streptomyces sp. NRRL S-87]|uniref:RNA polymerase sigma factor n=1 Tax=Streptomyces sp. NRRL S-87 TaxID=1463920 RepID=UPI0004C0FECC|nr:sigma-70 family RNA polymerase sigma factor [Streptomyces sp. NRRL S-87]